MPLDAPARRLLSVEWLFIGLILIWLLWVTLHGLLSGDGFTFLPYVLAPVLILAGAVLGRGTRWAWKESSSPAQWGILAIFILVGLATLWIDLYANAQAAVGLQLVAITALAILTRTRAEGLSSSIGIGVVVLLVIGVLLAAQAQAAMALLIPLVVLSASAVIYESAPSARKVVKIGAALIAVAVAAVIWLGNRITWPNWLNEGGSLSWARHELWRDALTLWNRNLFVGAGPGAFTEHSELASSTPHLAMAHSSVLQVGSELGLIGVLLFVGILAAGLGVAASGSRPAALIGVSAWTALAIHSMIDHLYEFPIVTIMVGVVIGWASNTRDPNPSQEALRGGS